MIRERENSFHKHTITTQTHSSHIRALNWMARISNTERYDEAWFHWFIDRKSSKTTFQEGWIARRCAEKAKSVSFFFTEIKRRGRGSKTKGGRRWRRQRGTQKNGNEFHRTQREREKERSMSMKHARSRISTWWKKREKGRESATKGRGKRKRRSKRRDCWRLFWSS